MKCLDQSCYTYVRSATKIFLDSFTIRQQQSRKTTAATTNCSRYITPLLFPISSKRAMSLASRIIINRRRRTIRRKGERGTSEKSRASPCRVRSLPRLCMHSAFVNSAHLYAIAQGKRRGGSFLHCALGGGTLVSVGHLGPAGVDGGRVPITQHSGAPTFVSTFTLACATSILRHRLYFCAARMQQPSGGRRYDNRPVGGQTIVYLRARRLGFAHITLYFATASSSS